MTLTASHRSRPLRLGLVLIACALLAAPSLALAASGDRSPDGVWREVGTETVAQAKLVESFDEPGSYRLFELDDLALFRVLREAPLEFTAAARPSPVVLTLPMPDGTFARFRVSESPILSEKLARENPDIKSYVAQGIDDPTHSARLSRTPLGFFALVVTPSDFILIERATNEAGKVYLSFRRSELPAPDGLSCTVEDAKAPQILAPQAPPSGANLRTYDLAIVTTAEYRNFYGTDAATLMRVQNVMTGVNALYEREVAIRFTIVCTSFYTNAGTDPFTNPENVDATLLNQADATLDADCAASNYEIGHLFHLRAGGGNSFAGRAGGSVVCQGDAGRAASTGTNANSGLWIVDLVPHEMGHQFSAAHTYNSTNGGCVERQAGSAYEIGAGTTIMSYACAGCTGEDANGGDCADAYFHTHSFDQITNYREAGGNCGAQTATGNTAPNVSAGLDRTIPRGTPFTLTATGGDPDGDAVTWCWEQYDLGAASPPLNGGASGPLFRSFLPVASASRTFPNLTDLLAGNPTPFEILPTANRTLTFRATARDNRAGGGGVNYDTVVLTVSGDPFRVLTPNGGEALNAGCTLNVTWQVGGGSVAPNVNILFSNDGGQTFPTTLASNVANDGAHEVTLPCLLSSTNLARIRIEGAGNIFFDVSDANFRVESAAPVANIDGPSEVVVNAACTAVIKVSGSVGDDCPISAGDVFINAQALGGTATVATNIVKVQNGPDEVTFSGTVTVSDLTGCPAVVRIRVQGFDACGFEDDDIVDVTVIDPIDPVVVTQAVGGEVGPTCTYLLPFSASITDNCRLAPSDVNVVVTNPSNNATIGTPQWVTNQVSNTELAVTGTVLISDLTSCPAVIRVEVSIEDGCDNAGSNTAEVEVVDNTPPEIAVTLNREFLWPPNHKLVDIVADVTVSDNCPNPSFVLTSITSNEPPNDLGDGDTEPDIVGAEFGTADTEFQLRSERMGPRSGRVYTCLYTASDNCGNSTSTSVEVRVEHDQSGNAVVVQLSGVGGVGSDYLAVVVPTPDEATDDANEPGALVNRGAGAPARRFEPASGLLAGNTAGLVKASDITRADVDGDGRVDAVALFALDKAEALRDRSELLDGPVGLHYRNTWGQSVLVPDLLAVPREDAGSPVGAAVVSAVEASRLGFEGVIPPSAVASSGPATPAPELGNGVDEGATPAVTRLVGMRPNPFFRLTSIAFELARPARVTLEVYSPAGARVRGVADLAFEPGRHSVAWDGRDDSGRRVPPGVYFVRFVADGKADTGKALLLP